MVKAISEASIVEPFSKDTSSGPTDAARRNAIVLSGTEYRLLVVQTTSRQNTIHMLAMCSFAPSAAKATTPSDQTAPLVAEVIAWARTSSAPNREISAWRNLISSVKAWATESASAQPHATRINGVTEEKLSTATSMKATVWSTARTPARFDTSEYW